MAILKVLETLENVQEALKITLILSGFTLRTISVTGFEGDDAMVEIP